MRGVEQIPWLYDAMFFVLERTGFKRWREWLVAGAKGRTLEVGCGTGRNLPRYSEGIEVFALEPDAVTLKVAQGRVRLVGRQAACRLGGGTHTVRSPWRAARCRTRQSPQRSDRQRPGRAGAPQRVYALHRHRTENRGRLA